MRIGRIEEVRERCKNLIDILRMLWKVYQNLCLKNLRNMPANSGYKWRGVIFYGYKKEEKGKPVCIHEKVKGVNYLHEYTEDRYNKYIKHQDNKGRNNRGRNNRGRNNRGRIRKELVYTEERRRLK